MGYNPQPDLGSTIELSELAGGTDGELITWGADGTIATVSVGTATHVLTSNGIGTAPTFQVAAGGGFTVENKTGGFTAAGDYFYTVNASGGSVAIVLPAASANAAKRIYIVLSVNPGANPVTVTRAGSDTIEGSTSKTGGGQYAKLFIISDGIATWYVEELNAFS